MDSDTPGIAGYVIKLYEEEKVREDK